jgi:DNA mismatch repair protein MutL
VEIPTPQTVQLPAELAREVWGFEVELEALGFRFEPFGTEAVRLTATLDVAPEPERAFLAALEALAGGEDLAKAMACKGSTKFGEGLSRAQMQGLLQEWADCEFPKICPHGRPIVKRTRLSELLKEFGRA